MRSITATASADRTHRKTREGVVTSNKMQKTIVVQITRLVRHPVYNRVMKQVSSFKAHDETNQAKVGDWVKIMETRPLSRDKRWRLVEILKRASTAPPVPGSEETEAPAKKATEAGTAAKPGSPKEVPMTAGHRPPAAQGSAA